MSHDVMVFLPRGSRLPMAVTLSRLVPGHFGPVASDVEVVNRGFLCVTLIGTTTDIYGAFVRSPGYAASVKDDRRYLSIYSMREGDQPYLSIVTRQADSFTHAAARGFAEALAYRFGGTTKEEGRAPGPPRFTAPKATT